MIMPSAKALPLLAASLSYYLRECPKTNALDLRKADCRICEAVKNVSFGPGWPR